MAGIIKYQLTNETTIIVPMIWVAIYANKSFNINNNFDNRIANKVTNLYQI
jgi:hypothetical protein